MMTETAKIAGFGNDGLCVDRPDAGGLSQESAILAVSQQLVGLRFDLIGPPGQGACFVNDHPEHANGRYIKRQRQAAVCGVPSPPFARPRERPCSEPLRASTHDDFRAYA